MTTAKQHLIMIESFEIISSLESRATKISKLIIDFDKFPFVHNDKIMKNKLTCDIHISLKFKQKRRRKN